MTAPKFASNVDGMPVASTTGSVGASSGAAATCDRNVTITGASPTAINFDAENNRTSGSIGWCHRRGGSGTAFTTDIKDSSGNIRFKVLQVSGDTFKMQYWNGSALTDLGVTWTNPSANVIHFRLDFSGLGTASGSYTFRSFIDTAETEQTNQTFTGLNLSGTTNFRSMTMTTNGTSDLRISAVFFRDNSGQTTYVYQNIPTANGADTDGTGTFSSITTTGSAYDGTFISLPSSGNHRSVKNSANRNYDGRTVKAVGFPARLRCGSTGPTQCKPYLTIGGTRYYFGTVTLTTSFTSYVFVWETDPSTSAAWTLTAAQASSLEYGIEVV